MSAHEHRAHARIAIEVSGYVWVDERRLGCTVLDVSSGGAKLRGPDDRLATNTTLDLELALEEGDPPLVIRARVVRSSEHDGAVLHGVQFAEMNSDTARRLSGLLTALAHTRVGGNRRAFSRVHRRLDIWCKSQREYSAIMRDISRDGLSMHVDEALEIGERLEIAIVLKDKTSQIALPCRVLRCERVDERYEVGLRFDPRDALQDEKLDAVLAWALTHVKTSV